MSARRRLVWFIGAAALGLSGFAIPYAGGNDPDPWAHLLYVLSREAFVVAGILAMIRRPGNRVGPLLVLVGIVWMLPVVQVFGTPFTETFAELLKGSHWILLAHLVLAFPTGRLTTRAERAVVGAFYVYAVPNAIGSLPFWDPKVDCPGCPANLVLIAHRPEWEAPIQWVLGVIGALLVLSAAGVLLRRWRRASSRERRALLPVFLSAIPLIGTGLWDALSLPPLPSVADLAVAALPVGFLVGLLRARLDRFAVSDLVVDLGSGLTGPRLRDVLARALRDPSVELAYWLPERAVYVDPSGRAIALPQPDSGRAATVIESNGVRLAALVHDASLVEEAELVTSVGAAARLALENERLEAEVRTQLEEVRASRERIVEATDAERRRLERDLHDGTQQRLVNLSLAVRVAQEQAALDPKLSASLSEVADEVRLALSELREFGRGLHPAILTEAGLGPAVESLAERSALPVRIVGAPGERLPGPVEAAAYFVVSESLTNAAKHSGARAVSVEVRREGDHLRVEVADDGAGGADRAGGSGLRGLEDRVAALGGSLEVDSPRGGGTRVTAVIPCA